MRLKSSFGKIFCLPLSLAFFALVPVAYAQDDEPNVAPGDLSTESSETEVAPGAAPAPEAAAEEPEAAIQDAAIQDAAAEPEAAIPDAEPASEAASAAAAPATPANPSNVTVESVRKGTVIVPRRAGEFRLKIAVQRPTFNDGLKCYKEMYGGPTDYPMLSADWYFIDAFATIGLGFHGGYYSDRGHPLAQASNCNGEAYELVEDSKESLTFIPLQGVATIQISPFSGRWITFEAWGGAEWLYFSNARVEEQSTTTTSTTTSTSTETKQKSIRGEKVSTVIGGSASILLNPLDQQTVASMRRSMGFGYVYLTPGIEIVSTMKKDAKRLSFGRTSYSLGFTFETF